MGKRYQFFISSTFWDLENIRKEVRQSLLQSGQIPAGMEDFSATGEAQMDMIERVLKNCDFCILIIGGRYGTVAEGHDKSYTEREYEYIKDKAKLPILAFTHTHPEELESPEHKETNETKAKLDKFRNSLHHLNPTPWGNSTELLLAIKTSIMDIVTNGLYPEAIGWVRGNTVASADLTAEQNALLKENKALKTENEKLKTELGKNESAIPDIAGLDDVMAAELWQHNANVQLSLHKPTWGDLFFTIAKQFNILREDTHGEDIRQFFGFNEDAWQIVCVQFEELGLIRIYNGASDLWWSLTDKGEKLVRQALTARKQDKEAESP